MPKLLSKVMDLHRRATGQSQARARRTGGASTGESGLFSGILFHFLFLGSYHVKPKKYILLPRGHSTDQELGTMGCCSNFCGLLVLLLAIGVGYLQTLEPLVHATS